MTAEILLVPVPQQLERMAGHFALPHQPLIYLASIEPDLHRMARRLASKLAELGHAPTLTAAPGGAPHFSLRVDPHLLPRAQSYRLSVDRTGVSLSGSDAPGLFYGLCTLLQLLTLAQRDSAGALPYLRIVDWPDFPNRGVMLDVTRDKVPTMATLFALVEQLASLKINQLQLYTEHTFAYRGHEVVWQDASPITGEEILALDAHCREHLIELVPNQNSFGHLYRWLRHDQYRPLAEVPEGWVHPFGAKREPYGLAPNHPGSIALLADLYDQLLPHFSSRQFNPCLDETFDLGMGQSRELCAEKGPAQVYLDFVLQVYDLVKRRGRTMQFWGDIVLKHPELIAALPKDVILLDWGYEADHPFAAHGEQFAAAGLSFYVCPGTSSWASLAGRTENALGNLRNAAISGKRYGAIGYLNTDWGDFGHWQPLPVSYLGYMAGAAYSWNIAAAEDESALDIPALLDRHVFGDAAGIMGRLACDLGNVYREGGYVPMNGSLLFWQFLLPGSNKVEREGPIGEFIRQWIQAIEQMAAAANFDLFGEAIDDAMVNLEQARLSRPDAESIQAEYQWVADMLRFAARLGAARNQQGGLTPVQELAPAQRRVLAAQLQPLLGRHREIWLLRNRPGGQEDSAHPLRELLAALETDISQ